MLYSNFVIIIHISCLIAQFKLIIHIYNPNNFFLCSFLKHLYISRDFFKTAREAQLPL